MMSILTSLQTLLLIFYFLNFLLPNTLICVSSYKGNLLYDSLSRMEELLKSQVKVRQALEKNRFLVAKDRQHTKVLDNFIARCLKEEETAATLGAERYLHNPINSFSLITRLSKDLAFVEEFLDGTCKETPNYRPQIYKLKGDQWAGPIAVLKIIDAYLRPLGEFPSINDLEGAVAEFTRLQLLYDLDPFLLANGTLVNPYNNETRVVIEQVSPMTPDDCYELSLVEYIKDDRSRNIAWLIAALKMLKTPKDEMIVTKAELLSRLAGEYYESGNLESTIVNLEESMVAAPFRSENRELRKVIDLLKKQIKEKVRCKQPVYDFKLPGELKKPSKEKLQDFSYPGLCVKQPRSYINPNSSCHYSYGPHAFLKLVPTRIEVLSHSPFIVMYHDFISDMEIEELMRLSRPRLLSAPSLIDQGEKKEEIKYCNHQLAWISDTATPIVEGLTRKISRVTRLNLRNFSEEFQVANYGLGGYYGPHYDFIQTSNFSKTVGKTYATMLLYLTDVLEGGATIFIGLNMTVYPRKNSALFWLSLDESGADDFRTQHAACQTLHGNRWVASKWITFAGQELVRPCPVTMKFKKRPKKKSKTAKRKIRI